MKLKPVNDKIVVKPIAVKGDEVTESGIILPDTATDGALLEGEVIAVSKGMYSINGTQIPFVVQAGDTILYGKHNGGQEYKLNGEDVIIMSQNEVMSIVEEK
jgi:chaperonin GroES